MYITYELDAWSKSLNTGSTLGNSLFGSVKLTKNADPDKYIWFNSCSLFSWTDQSIRKNVIVSGVDNCSSVHIDSRNKNILILGEGPTQSVDNAKQKKLNILLILKNQRNDLG